MGGAFPTSVAVTGGVMAKSPYQVSATAKGRKRKIIRERVYVPCWSTQPLIRGPHPGLSSGALTRGSHRGPPSAAGSENEKHPPLRSLERSRKGWRGYANEGVGDGTVVRSASLLG